MENKTIFRTNPQKASARVAINSFMVGSIFVILSIIWSLNPKAFPQIITIQLVMAIPFLYISSLAYAKIGYWNETKLWDGFGWFTNNLGNGFILNAIGLMVATINMPVALLYFGITIALMLIYSLINLVDAPYLFREKMFKFLIFLVILFLGGILPLII